MPGISTLKDIFLSCVYDLQSPGQLKAFTSDVLSNITHRSQVSLVLGCHKYWLYVFIRRPLLPITANNYILVSAKWKLIGLTYWALIIE